MLSYPIFGNALTFHIQVQRNRYSTVINRKYSIISSAYIVCVFLQQYDEVVAYQSLLTMPVSEFASRVLKGVAGSLRLTNCSSELPTPLYSGSVKLGNSESKTGMQSFSRRILSDQYCCYCRSNRVLWNTWLFYKESFTFYLRSKIWSLFNWLFSFVLFGYHPTQPFFNATMFLRKLR